MSFCGVSEDSFLNLMPNDVSDQNNCMRKLPFCIPRRSHKKERTYWRRYRTLVEYLGGGENAPGSRAL
jgi:hypothetical protein